MRLADFILRDMDAILIEWDTFARTCSPRAARMSPVALRDHAQQILEAVSADLRSPQSTEAEVLKSKGWRPRPVMLRKPQLKRTRFCAHALDSTLTN
jgi:hypothetical protein